MASSSTQITVSFDPSKLKGRLDEVDIRMQRIIAGQFLYHQPIMTSEAKLNAPWTDRTGNARAGLHTSISLQQTIFELTLAHSMWYGFYLETAHSGKYAIILPTIQKIGKLLLDRLAHSLERLEAGE